MLTPTPHNPSEGAPPDSAIVRVVTASDVQWNRRVFRAPPLDVQPPLDDVAAWLVSQRTLPLDRAD